MYAVKSLDRILFLFGLVVLLAPTATAGPLFPGISASQSANGRFLVVTHLHFHDPNASSGMVAGATFEVMQAEPSLSGSYGLHSSSRFYTDTSYTWWQVTVTGAASSLVLPIVSNDGLSLLLVSVSGPLPASPVLALYRKQEQVARLVRDYSLADLWTERELYPEGTGGTTFGDSGSTPKWFADSWFEFSSDDQTLLYTTKWGDELSLRLMDGSVTRLVAKQTRAPAPGHS